MIKIRLSLLADRLEKIDALPKSKRKRKFDLDTWVSKDSCGTAACAVGEATFIKRFRELGLRYDKRTKAPAFKGFKGWTAVREFFGITHGEAADLFLCSRYKNSGIGIVNPGLVAQSIRKLVETGAI